MTSSTYISPACQANIRRLFFGNQMMLRNSPLDFQVELKQSRLIFLKAKRKKLLRQE